VWKSGDLPPFSVIFPTLSFFLLPSIVHACTELVEVPSHRYPKGRFANVKPLDGDFSNNILRSEAAQAKGKTFMILIIILATVVAVVIAIALYDHFHK
jgi:hypothetical protein